MKVILMAAGRSRRAKPIEDKNFLTFCGKSLVQHQIEALNRAGFPDIVMVGGAHNLEPLKTLAERLTADVDGLAIEVVEQKNLEDGMAGAMLTAKSAVENEEAILVISSNDVVDFKAYERLSEAISNESEASSDSTSAPRLASLLLAKRVTEYFPGGYLSVDEAGQVQSIVEKPSPGEEPSDLINLVLHVHFQPKRFYEFLEKTISDKDDRYEVALDAMIQAGHSVQAVPYEGYWQAIKYPWHVLDVAQHFLEEAFQETPESERIHPSAHIDEGATVIGDVIVEEGVKILSGAHVVGPVYIGAHSVIATNALVRDSMVGQRCVIGFSTEVARSVLGSGVWTHSNYIGDSVIGDDVSFGAGTVTGNLRFDEAPIAVKVGEKKIDSGRNKLGLFTGNHIRTGINTSLMPGIKIGSNSLIGAGITVAQDIPEGSFVTGKTELNVTPNRMTELPSRESFKKKLNPETPSETQQSNPQDPRPQPQNSPDTPELAPSSSKN